MEDGKSRRGGRTNRSSFRDDDDNKDNKDIGVRAVEAVAETETSTSLTVTVTVTPYPTLSPYPASNPAPYPAPVPAPAPAPAPPTGTGTDTYTTNINMNDTSGTRTRDGYAIRRQQSVMIKLKNIASILPAAVADAAKKTKVMKSNRNRERRGGKGGKGGRSGTGTMINLGTGEDKQALSDLAMIEQSLPKVFSLRSGTEVVMDEIKQHHRWFAIYYYYSESFPRFFRMLSMLSAILAMLFVQSVTYNLAGTRFINY